MSWNRLIIRDANLIFWNFVSCAYFCDATSFFILNLAAFAVLFFFSFFFYFSFVNLCSNILWCSMSHSVCVGKDWFIAGSSPEWGGERVECICVFYVFVVEMHKTFFFSLSFLSSSSHLCGWMFLQTLWGPIETFGMLILSLVPKVRCWEQFKDEKIEGGGGGLVNVKWLKMCTWGKLQSHHLINVCLHHQNNTNGYYKLQLVSVNFDLALER